MFYGENVWGGVLTLIGGAALLAYSAYLFHAGFIWSLGIGGGIALILVGVLQLFYYFDDRRRRK